MKKQILITLALYLAVLLTFSFLFDIWTPAQEKEKVIVGFLYENDVSTPATYNFAQAEKALKTEYGERVETLSYSNVQAEEIEDPVRELIRKGSEIIFTNSHSTQVAELAAEFPQAQFCQVSFSEIPEDAPMNYHTFGGELDEGSYVCGVAAGMKLREMIDFGEITAEQAKIGYVCAYLDTEALSGASAFLLGALTEAPEAEMTLRQTRVWSNYTAEKKAARALIDEGCLIIAQQTNTSGPAMACEEAWPEKMVYLFGMHMNMQDVAPSTFVTGTRVNYQPYVSSAIAAILTSQSIEEAVEGNLHGRMDLSAGFDQGWVEILELNEHLAAEGTEKRVSQLMDEFRKGSVQIFQGAYTAVNPENPEDTLPLTSPFQEYANSSWPAFRYVLDGYVKVE